MDCVFGVWLREGQGWALQRPSLAAQASQCGPSAYHTAQIVLDPGARGGLIQYRPGAAFLGGGRIRNRAELAQALGPQRRFAGDQGLMLDAYLRWGEGCCPHLIGDWLFAAWDEERRELVLARDHIGCTALYYQITPDAFAFSTSRRALLDLKLAPVSLDEAMLAKILVSGPDDGEATIHSSIRRLPPAHYLRVTPTQMTSHRYWGVEDIGHQRRRDRRDYIAGFRAIFDQAVCESLSPAGRTASHLSGGLDSGSITAIAARHLSANGGRLSAYTSVPIASTAAFTTKDFGDEWPFAHATAQAHDNIDHHAIDAAATTPMAAIRTALKVHLQPLHSAGNKYWMMAIEQAARAAGHDTLLIGQMGNAGISWTGAPLSQPLRWQWQTLGRKGWLKACARYVVPPRWRLYRGLQMDRNWTRAAISPSFAERIDLRGILLSDPHAWPQGGWPMASRLQILGLGRTKVGAQLAENAAATGIHITDPSSDPRVLAYCLSIPDDAFFDHDSGIDRWVIRAAMDGRLPDMVRLNRRRGRQAGDLVVRLRACADEVEQALTECEAGPAAEYLNLAYLRQLWARMKVEDSNFMYKAAVTTLTRGLMAGLFVNGFGKSW